MSGAMASVIGRVCRRRVALPQRRFRGGRHPFRAAMAGCRDRALRFHQGDGCRLILTTAGVSVASIIAPILEPAVSRTSFPTVAAAASSRSSGRSILGAWAVAFMLALTLISPPPAYSATDADWAWPGMQYDLYKDGAWYSCSVGFPAWNDAGTRYFISAGHCFRSASGTHCVQPDGQGIDVYAPSDHRTPVGFERTYTIPSDDRYDDVSLVEMYAGKKLDGYGWQHIPDTPAVGAVGDEACLAGYRHSTSNCGTVTATGRQQTLKGYPWTVNVSTASFCALGGDSGGAVYNKGGALGVEISRDTAHNDTGSGTCSSSFIPIALVMQILHKQDPSLSI